MHDERVVLGSEYDQRLRDDLRAVLVNLGASPVGHDWMLAGSQELETLEVRIGTGLLHVESETYMGLSVSGPSDLVRRVESEVQARAKERAR